MNKQSSIQEELFCIKFELDALANSYCYKKSERWIKGFIPSTTESHHLKRYEFALQFTKDKKVLDIACGCGFGSYLMAKDGKASLVIGVDLDKEAIRYGNYKYSSPSVQRFIGDATEFKFQSKFDLIVSFETVEHLKNTSEFVQNLYNNLDENGILLISTPINRITTTTLKNPYHEIEWSFSDFHQLFKSKFSIEEIYLQDVLVEIQHSTIKKLFYKILKKLRFPLNKKKYIKGKDLEIFRSQYDMNQCFGGYQILVLKKNL